MPTRRKKRRKLSEPEKILIQELRAQGMTGAKITKELEARLGIKRHESLIYYFLRKTHHKETALVKVNTALEQANASPLQSLGALVDELRLKSPEVEDVHINTKTRRVKVAIRKEIEFDV